MHCNSEQRIRETLRRLALEPNYRRSFLERSSDISTPEVDIIRQTWSQFVEFAKLDPYTPERVQLSRRWKANSWCRQWVERALEVCKHHDSEFSLVLEESMKDRFEVAVALLGAEGKLPQIAHDKKRRPPRP